MATDTPPTMPPLPQPTAEPSDDSTLPLAVLEPMDTRCRDCGTLFTTPVASICGRTLFASQCDDCAALEETQRLIRPSRDLAREWLGKVGSYYADFEMTQLPYDSQPIAEIVLAWTVGAKGIGLVGPTGTGKSRILHELGQRLYAAGVDVHPTSGIEFGQKVGRKADDMGIWHAYLDRCERCVVLLLDDADKMNLTAATEAEYYGLLEMRRKWLRPILATLNLTGVELAGTASANRGAPIITRLRDLCQFISMKPEPKKAS